MWLGIFRNGQQAPSCPPNVVQTTQQVTQGATCCYTAGRVTQHAARRRRSAATQCNRQGHPQAADSWTPQWHRRTQSAAAVAISAAACHDTQQQIFPSSSGMQSSLLQLQQQQVTQLLHVSPQAHSSYTALELQQHDHYQRQQQEQQLLPPSQIAEQQHHCTPTASNVCFTESTAQQQCGSFRSDGQQQQGRQHPQHGVACQQACAGQQWNGLQGQQQHAQQATSQQQQQQQQSQQQKQKQRRRQQQPQQDDLLQRMLLLSHPAQYTGWIKRSSTLHELQQLQLLHGGRFNVINLSAMLIQLARLYGDCGWDKNREGRTSPTSTRAAAQQLALQLAEQLQQQLRMCGSARQAANASWALAVLRCDSADSILQQTAAELVADDGRLLRASQPQELATLAWSYSKLQYDPCCALWTHLLAAAQQQILHRFRPQELAMLLWAFASQQQRQGESWRAGLEVGNQQKRWRQQMLGDMLPGLDQQEGPHSSGAVCTSASEAGQGQWWARSAAHSSSSSSRSFSASNVAVSSSDDRPQHRVPSIRQGLQALLPAVSTTIQQQLQQRAQRYKPQELSMILWSMAVLNHRDVPLLQVVGTCMQQQVQQGMANSQDISNSVWALGKLQIDCPGLLTAVAAASRIFSSCSIQELSLVLYGCAAMYSSPSAAQRPQQHTHQLWQQGLQELQHRLAAGRQLQAAELATLLQACVLLLRSSPEACHEQQQNQGNQQPQQSTADSSSGKCWSRICSVVSDQHGAVTGGAASVLLSVLYQHMAAQHQLIVGLGCKHIACVLSALAGIERQDLRPPAAVVAALLAAARSEVSAMNRQQLCMTAWAAARLAADRRSADDATMLLMDNLQQVALSKVSGMQPQQLSILAWSHARLWNLGDSLLLHQLAKTAVKQLNRFGPQALANLAWAFARARHYDGVITAAMARRARALLPQFNPAELSNLMWGLVTLGCRQQALFRAVAVHAAQHCSGWDAKACAKLAEAFTRSGIPARRFRSLFFALGDALTAQPSGLGSLTVHELAQVAAAFSVARVRHRALISAVAGVALQRLDSMSLADVVRLVWALAVLHHKDDELLDAVSARIAAEMTWKSDLVPENAETGTNSSSDGGHGDAEAVAAGSWHSNSRLSSSFLRGKLRPQHLPRLAWAYKSLRHGDACWYLAAARHTASLQHWQMHSSTESNSRSRTEETSGQHVISGLTRRRPSGGGLQRDSWRQQHEGVGRRLPAGAQNGFKSRSSSKANSSSPLLQRPLYRPVCTETAPVLVHAGQHQQQQG